MNNNPVKNKKAVDLLTINAEQLIDKYEKQLHELKSFILPGGS